MSTLLLAISGKKQSGKGSLGDFLVRNRNELFGGQTVISLGWADALKRQCCDLFNIPDELAWGGNQEKNQPSPVKWSSFPIVEDRLAHSDSEYMTVREVLQYYGTELVRSMNDAAWVQLTLKNILQQKPYLAVITDTRFPIELTYIWQAGGKVIRLTRNPCPHDQHLSETALDDMPLSHYDAVIDNKCLSVTEQNQALAALLQRWGWTKKLASA